MITERVGLFEVTYDGHSVVTLRAKSLNEPDWLHILNMGHSLMSCFKRTRPGSDWGCDGVGYAIQKRLGEVVLHRSGVGPVAFERGLVTCKQVLLEVCK